jgi:hypothetical protein
MLLVLTLFLSLTPYQARSRPVGSDITLEGFVTVPSGVFSSFMGDNGFVLSDKITGIYVVTDNKGYRSLGSAVEVTGRLADNGHGLLVLRARSIRPQKGRSLIRPWKMDSPALHEVYEGKLVQAQGEVLRFSDDLPYGHKLFLRLASGKEMQVFLPVGTKPDAALLAPGRRLEVVGFCAQYDQVYELVVRSPKDLRVLP